VTDLLAEPTEELLRRIRDGNEAAQQALYQRCLPLLQRWAHGRLPRGMRDVADTDDLVQVTLLRALKHLGDFQAQGSGGFLGYLRTILLNEVRGEMRKRQVRGQQIDLNALELVDEGDSAIEQLVGRDRLRAYETALAALSARHQELIVMRLEFGMSYPEIALETGDSPDSVRMAVTRALKSLTEGIATLG
jgi:RNA polymerase sigma factor (sigma-70 family)